MKKLLCLVLAISMFIHLPIACDADDNDSYIKEEYQEYVYEIAGMYGICPELVLAIIENESSGSVDVVSEYGCTGLMQISPEWHTNRMERLGVTDLTDPYSNILVGCDYLLELFEKYHDINVVLAGYNAGEYSETCKKAKEGYWTSYAKAVSARSEELERLHE